jgi:tetratricopeptide (TPR) repeat protein
VAALAYGAVILSSLGETAQALQYEREALEQSVRIGHPHTLANVLAYMSVASQLRRDAPGALKWADKGIALSREYGFRVSQAWMTIIRSWALSELGHPHEGLATMQKAIAHWRASGLMAGAPYNLSLLAEIHLKLEQPQEALRAVDEALSIMQTTGERSSEPELYRLQGVALRALGQEHQGRECLVRALSIAREQGTLTYEHHALESLGLWPSGARESAHAL